MREISTDANSDDSWSDVGRQETSDDGESTFEPMDIDSIPVSDAEDAVLISRPCSANNTSRESDEIPSAGSSFSGSRFEPSTSSNNLPPEEQRETAEVAPVPAAEHAHQLWVDDTDPIDLDVQEALLLSLGFSTPAAVPAHNEPGYVDVRASNTSAEQPSKPASVARLSENKHPDSITSDQPDNYGQREVLKHIVSFISDHESLLVLRQTSKYWREIVDERLSEHLAMFACPSANGPQQPFSFSRPFSFSQPSSFSQPHKALVITSRDLAPAFWFREWTVPLDDKIKTILSSARVIDIDSFNPVEVSLMVKAITEAAPAPRLRAIRFDAPRILCGRHHLEADCAVIFAPNLPGTGLRNRAPYLSGTGSQDREYALPSGIKSAVLNVRYDPGDPGLSLISPWMYMANMDRVVIIFNAVNIFSPFEVQELKPESWLLKPLVRLIIANHRSTEFVLVGITDMPIGWLSIEDDDAPEAEPEDRIAGQIWAHLFYAIRKEYDDEYTQQDVMSRLQTAVQFLTVWDYMTAVGDETFALHTETTKCKAVPVCPA